jgi:hypothetical protein
VSELLLSCRKAWQRRPALGLEPSVVGQRWGSCITMRCINVGGAKVPPQPLLDSACGVGRGSAGVMALSAGSGCAARPQLLERWQGRENGQKGC